MGPNTILSFRNNKSATSEKTYRQAGLKGWTDRWKDRPFFIGPFWPFLGVQQEKPQKNLYTLQELLVGDRLDTGGTESSMR